MPEALPVDYRVWAWQGGREPRALVTERRPLPCPAAGEVLVRNRAIGLNPVDWKVLGGGLVDWRPGHVPGVDGAGEVVAAGEGVNPALVGARVAYHQSLAAHGSFAEYVPIRAAVLLRVPDTLDLGVAAGFPCPALTAWLGIGKLPDHPGETLLISGAGGAVGRYLVQMAAARGWQVTAMCHARHRARMVALGAHDWLPGAAPDGETLADPRFTAIIDSIGAEHALRLTPALRANGHIVCIEGRVPEWPNPAFGRALSLHEVALGALHRHGDERDWARLTSAGEAMLRAVADGVLHPEPLVEGDFEQLPAMLEALRSRNFTGKPIIRLA
jgi:NADPH:quinone reductase-like Zn-dependent oxidoreductase